MIILNYLLYYLIIIPISLLPFPVLYVISDFAFLVIYYLVGYRKKVVRQNLHNSFPEKSEAEILDIEKNFYHHFCDVMIESLKSFTLSQSQISKRMVCKNPELLDKYFEAGRSIILAGGHYNNWEWIATGIDPQIKHDSIAIYSSLSNKFFEKKMLSTRQRFGLRMISTKVVAKVFEETKNNLTATIFAIDQSPGNPNRCYWMTFLNQPTGVAFGAERYAKKYDYPVLFGTIQKVKRGYYTFEFNLVTDHPRQTKEGEIIETATLLLEKEIIKEPQYWLWSHRRWKHKRPEEIKVGMDENE